VILALMNKIQSKYMVH